MRAAQTASYVEQAKGTKGFVIDIRNYPSEFVVFALWIPCCVGRALRVLYARLIGKWPPVVRRALLGAAILALAAKGALIAWGPSEGFPACYRSGLYSPPSGQCERAYGHPFFLGGVTRIDPRLDFLRCSNVGGIGLMIIRQKAGSHQHGDECEHRSDAGPVHPGRSWWSIRHAQPLVISMSAGTS